MRVEGDAFVRDIEGFDAMDKYVMRWRGHFNAEQQGYYAFSTTSDDGARLSSPTSKRARTDGRPVLLEHRDLVEVARDNGEVLV